MLISRNKEPLHVVVNDEELEQVDHFKYFGSVLSENAECTKEIRTRIALAKTAFNNKKTLLLLETWI